MKLNTFSLLLLSMLACSHQETELTEEGKVIYVVSQGWHTGLIVSSTCLEGISWPDEYDFSKFNFLLVGWGDKDYYQHSDFNLWYGIKAALWPTASVLQVAGINDIQGAERITDEIIPISISNEGYENLCLFLYENFELENDTLAIPGEKGFSLNSRFFMGNQKYYLTKNSNVWTAIALKEAGLDINPYSYQTKEMVLKMAKKKSNVRKKEEK
ncbi:DUF2459 domain-containing protein [Marivirga sp. S37H4]|uniref:DUF2459 domain-containing protein n=1 Tax=Marivirga aurantiaca TaxID=2802615 RepID=A0A934WX09_9BACT|nr:DUF2459 domain-containing protein [Marivirga aurantiaca]MBK6264421.1 DUF2459 domain-containing protein [Marivirga aurantiaca]